MHSKAVHDRLSHQLDTRSLLRADMYLLDPTIGILLHTGTQVNQIALVDDLNTSQVTSADLAQNLAYLLALPVTFGARAIDHMQ
jgi:hypothetical protein